MALDVLGLAVGAAALLGAAGLFAACLRLRSPMAFVLAAQLFAWTMIVFVPLALSPFAAVTRTSTRAWLVAAAAIAVGSWTVAGRPVPPVAHVIAVLRHALGDPLIAVLGAVCAVALLYVVALATLTPENEGDALAYHVARAAFWYQQHSVRYVENAVETRLNVNPPNAELGVLFTMLASGTQRFVGLVQVGSSLACATAAAGIARRVGLGVKEALFGGLVLMTLPVVTAQTWTAQNDLVVASLLATAGFFVLGRDRVDFALAGLAAALAIGAKFTAVLSLPILVLLALVAPGGRRVAKIVSLVAIGAIGGSVWYVVNLVETGRWDGGLSQRADQAAPHSVNAVLGTIQSFTFNLLDLSGLDSPGWRWDQRAGLDSSIFRVVGIVVAGVAVIAAVRRGTYWRCAPAVAAGLVVATAPTLVAFAYHLLYVVDRPSGSTIGPGPNIAAGATPSWYGPLGAVGLVAGVVLAVREARRRAVARAAIVLACAPVMLLTLLASTIVWDPWRGRFAIFAFVLAAGSWGLMLRERWLAWGVTGVGAITMVLVLVNAESKPSGVHPLQTIDSASVWGKPEWWVQTVLRLDPSDRAILRAAESHIPSDASVAVAPRGNDFLSPYFGRDLTRRVELVRDAHRVAADAQWLVISRGVTALGCRRDWRFVPLMHGGWLMARRIGSSGCSRRAALAPLRSRRP